MHSTPRNPPRFLPTLTEVVQATSLEAASAPKLPSSDDIVRTVLQTVGPLMERRLAEEAQGLLRELLAEQMSLLQARLRDEMEILVRQVASEAANSLKEIRPA
jgi:hypothetical protein